MFDLDSGEVFDVCDVSSELTKILDDGCIANSKAEYAVRGSGVGEVAYNRIGAGYIGIECVRELAYRYHRVPKDELGQPSTVSEGELTRHAGAGFWTEKYVMERFNDGGLIVKNDRGDGKQYNWLDARMPNGQYAMAGEVDGLIVGKKVDVPGELGEILDKGYPVIWESKKMTAKKFEKFSGISSKTGKDLMHKGVKYASTEYYSQAQINMVCLEQIKDVPYEKRRVLFTGLNLDTMKLYAELIPFDIQQAQWLTDRAVRVIQSSSPSEFSRLYDRIPDKGLNGCRFCDWQRQCWGG